jgi:hypothetical protein
MMSEIIEWAFGGVKSSLVERTLLSAAFGFV